MITSVKLIIAALLTLVACPYVTNAQLRGHHLLIDYGLGSGTQPPPSIIVNPVFYWYNATKLITSGGRTINTPDLKVVLLGLGGSVVTNVKILKANYGFTVFPAFISERVEGNRFEEYSPLGLTDLFVQPVQLGWHFNRVDVLVGYSLYLPIGKYEFAGEHNKGLGMLTNEFSLGSTVYFDKKKTWNISSIVFYEVHSEKENTDVKTGSILTSQGGLAKTFYVERPSAPIPMAINVGMIYYMQFKVTNDRIPIGNRVFTGNKDHIYALGPEGSILFPKTMSAISLRWAAELGARNRFEGSTYLLSYVQFIKMFREKEK